MWLRQTDHSIPAGRPTLTDWPTLLLDLVTNFPLSSSTKCKCRVKLPLRTTSLQWPLFCQVDGLYIHSYFNHSTTVSSKKWQGPLKCIPTAKQSSWEWPVNQWLMKFRMVYTKLYFSYLPITSSFLQRPLCCSQVGCWKKLDCSNKLYNTIFSYLDWKACCPCSWTRGSKRGKWTLAIIPRGAAVC